MFRVLKNQNGHSVPMVGAFGLVCMIFIALWAAMEFIAWFTSILPKDAPKLPSFVEYYHQIAISWPFWISVCVLIILLIIPSFLGKNGKPNL